MRPHFELHHLRGVSKIPCAGLHLMTAHLCALFFACLSDVPAATWPCPAAPAWNTRVALLPGQRPGSVRLQIDMRVNKVCLCGGAGQPDSRCVV